MKELSIYPADLAGMTVAQLVTLAIADFTTAERNLLLGHPAVRRIALGPRILRAETAAIAAIGVWMAANGDWA